MQSMYFVNCSLLLRVWNVLSCHLCNQVEIDVCFGLMTVIYAIVFSLLICGEYRRVKLLIITFLHR